MGLSSLDVDTTTGEAFAPGRGTASSDYEAAKRAAGIPTGGQPSALRMGRGKGIGGFLGTPAYAARFRLDSLSNELLDPVADLLGKTDFLLTEDRISSLDCLAFGYLSLLFYPAVPQAWVKETIQTKFPRIASYIRRLRKDIFCDEDIKPADVWTISSGPPQASSGMLLPWQPRSQGFMSSALDGAREIAGNLPLVSWFTQGTSVVHMDYPLSSKNMRSSMPSPVFINTLLGATAAATIGFASLAIHHRRSPREGALIFWALRPSTGFGEAGDILSIFANQMPTHLSKQNICFFADIVGQSGEDNLYDQGRNPGTTNTNNFVLIYPNLSTFNRTPANKMHRTYSMRQSRAPTASQIQNPPPPSSSTKSGRFFGKANIGHTFRHKSAGAFGPDLAKKLSQLVKMEKNVMRSMELVSRERMEVAQQLSIWGEACDDDVSDVTDKLGVLIYEIGELEDQYVDRYDQYRVTIKSIRNIEASVQPSRDRKQKITDQIAQLKYKEPNSPKIVVLEQELVRAEAESLVAEAQLSNITREKLKAAFTYQFDAMREHCEKLAIIAGYGKHLLELIDDNPVTPGETRQAYDGYEASKAIIQDCEDALTNWVSQNASVSSKLSQRSRTLSQRRRNATRRGEGVDLSGQDQTMDRESGLWIPASEHQGNGYDDRDELDDDEAHSTIASEQRGREEERVIAA
ncbi:hypothetical protein SNOG_00776 [Parastagonospora nodorum SN15]|uniref:Metaxin glutathione S-transferase domain-containing protein n=2 Tax=Phaeosphaeria nodorum (strain SN15 / ATCC MYA-4574 / FGSC 10173) TaxID=321614 RepID=Q0V5D8_PHANO|nr:hypothetical protein SNOG_00776 [Parastagonospora nodorum SN15]EAT92271.2 hypothetical protein SNOG_00776 [Parastagonospora nodorum SN15]